MSKHDRECTAAPTTQATAGIGHNGGPTTPLFGLHAAWLRFAEEVELRRLAKLHLRIERKKASMKVLVGERQRIMNRCIRRMRRDIGKN